MIPKYIKLKESINEKILKKAIYVQLVSDIHPDKIDLYWLSAQWLSVMNPSTTEERNRQELLLNKCVMHLNDQM